MPSYTHAPHPSEPLSDDVLIVEDNNPYYSQSPTKPLSEACTGKLDAGVAIIGVDGGLHDSFGSSSSSSSLLKNRNCLSQCLAQNIVVQKLGCIIPHGGLLSSVYNLASATLGAGILSVPAGFYSSGIVVAFVLLAVICALTIYSIRLLAIAKDKTGLRSYEEMARGLLGPVWDYFTAFLMFMFCWGTCVSYIMSVGDLLTPMLEGPNTNAFLQTENGHRLLIALVWFVGMLPLSLPKEINSLRYASVIGVMFIVFFVICMIIHSAQNGLKNGLRGDLILANSGMDATSGLSMFIFAFLNQVNVFEIYNEMTKPTPRNMTIVATLSMLLVCVLNMCSGFFGYADFGSELGESGSVLLLYDPLHEPLFMISYIGILVKLCVGFAICVQPARDAVYYCLGWGKTSDVTYWVNWLVSAAVALTALLLGMFIPRISVVFNLLGGVCGGFLGFLFPAYFYMYAGGFNLKNAGIWNYIGCLLLMVGGVVAVVFGTAVAIYGEIPE